MRYYRYLQRTFRRLRMGLQVKDATTQIIKHHWLFYLIFLRWRIIINIKMASPAQLPTTTWFWVSTGEGSVSSWIIQNTTCCFLLDGGRSNVPTLAAATSSQNFLISGMMDSNHKVLRCTVSRLYEIRPHSIVSRSISPSFSSPDRFSQEEFSSL